MSDSFAIAAARTPAEVRKVTIVMSVTVGAPAVYAAGYHFDIYDEAGEVLATRQGNLLPHISGAQQNTAKAFMDAMLAKAQATVE